MVFRLLLNILKKDGGLDMYERICYEHGNEKTGKKLLEIHKSCNCFGCKNKFGRRRANDATATVAADDMEAIKKAYAFLEKWKCKDPEKDLPVEYVRF